MALDPTDYILVYHPTLDVIAKIPPDAEEAWLARGWVLPDSPPNTDRVPYLTEYGAVAYANLTALGRSLIAAANAAAARTVLGVGTGGGGGSMTAAEILDAVKTVDGTGSGLDADLLDGHNIGTGAGDIPLKATVDSLISAAIANLLGAAPAAFDTLVEIATALQNDDTAIAGIITTLAAKAATSHTHAAGDIASGTLAPARLGSGTASGSTFLRGDGTWSAAPVSDPLTTVSASGTSTTANLANSGVFDVILTGNCTLAITGVSSGAAWSATFILRQDATGSRTVSWPSGTKWAGGAAPTLSTAGGSVDVVTLMTVDGGTTWLGFLGGKAIA